MKKMKTVSLILTAALTICTFLPLGTVFADAALIYEKPQRYDAVGKETIDFVETDIDIEAFKALLLPALKQKAEYIDISQFKIPSTQKNCIYNLVWYEIPESLDITLSISTSNGIVTKLWLYYSDLFDNYEETIKQCEQAANELLFGIADNPSLGDIEKILLIHDRLNIYCEYDYANLLDGNVPDESYYMSGFFINRRAVCAGYASAYKYLLDKVGIKNYYISSDALNHAWNIVYLNGKPYHVDSTWDDPVWDRCGRSAHTNFLQSTSKFSVKHNATDFDSTPVDTTYDNFYWASCDSAFQLIGNYIYYVVFDSTTKNQTIYRSPCSTIAKTSDDVAISTLSGKWFISSSSYYSSQSSLCTDGRCLYYNSPDNKIYKYDPATNKTSIFYEPEITTEYNHIFGFYYDGKKLVTEINNTPNLNRQTKVEQHTEIDYIDPDTCGKGNHISAVRTAGVAGTCQHPQGITPELICHACKKVLQKQQNYCHEAVTDHVDLIAPDYENGGTVSVYCSCGNKTDINVNSLSCRDFDRNGEITVNDYSLIVNKALSGNSNDSTLYDFDINADRIVDVLDVTMFERVMHNSTNLNCNFCVKLLNANNKLNEITDAYAKLLGISLSEAAKIISSQNQPTLLDGVDFEYAYRFTLLLHSIGADACITFDSILVA